MQAIQLVEVCKADICAPQEGTPEAGPADRPSLFAFLLALFDGQTAGFSGAAGVQQGVISVGGKTDSSADPAVSPTFLSENVLAADPSGDSAVTRVHPPMCSPACDAEVHPSSAWSMAVPVMDQEATAGRFDIAEQGNSVSETGDAGKWAATSKVASLVVSGNPRGPDAHPGEAVAGHAGSFVKTAATEIAQVQTVRPKGSGGPETVAELLPGGESESVPGPTTGTSGPAVVSFGRGAAKTQGTDAVFMDPWTWMVSAQDDLPSLPLRVWLSGRTVAPGEGPASMSAETTSSALNAGRPGQSADAVSPSLGNEMMQTQSTGGEDHFAGPAQGALPEETAGAPGRASQGKNVAANATTPARLVGETKSGVAKGRLLPGGEGSADGGRAEASLVQPNEARGASAPGSIDGALAKAIRAEIVNGAASETMVADAVGRERSAEAAGPKEAVPINMGHGVFASGRTEGSSPQPISGGVVQGVLKGVHLLLAQGRQTMRVRLKPDWLGDVRIEVSSGEQSVIVRLFAHHEGARKALSDNLSALQNVLTRSGIEVSQVTVFSEAPFDAASGGAHGRDAPFAGPPRPAAQAHGSVHDSPMKAPGLGSSSLSEGRLNLFA